MEVLDQTQPRLATELESYFEPFRENIVGVHESFEGPYGRKKIIYADWIASGRLYRPIEEKLLKEVGIYVANTHTETSFTGTVMTHAYEEARNIIKKHVNAASDDVLIPTGTGMTGAILKFQRILGLKVPEQVRGRLHIEPSEKPVIFTTHMEHHSNHTSWLETLAEVVMINSDTRGLVDLDHLEELNRKYADRPMKIASVTGCSNVTGIETEYHEIAKIMHRHNGLCFVDFACSAPYVSIDMHPAEKGAHLDAVYFSPHKFLGGPGTPGILIFSSKLYKNTVPDQPGGGTVSWTNPWGGHRYFDNIEVREDGGTPGFLQTIKAAMSIRLKEEMQVDKIHQREEELVAYVFERFAKVPGLHILADNIQTRLGVISFYIDDLHYNLCVKLLNDRYGIQVRGGCSCAGTYGHYLLNVDPDYSKQITDLIDTGDLSRKPGWIRLSLHPTMTNEEVVTVCDAVEEIAANHSSLGNDYEYDPKCNEFFHKSFKQENRDLIDKMFRL